MPVCGAYSGMLFWKNRCTQAGIGECSECGRPVCAQHSGVAHGAFLCSACYRSEIDDTRPWFSGWSSSSYEGGPDSSIDSVDSTSSSDSGGGDSGGGDGSSSGC